MSKYNFVITGLLIAILILSGGANWEIFRQAQLARQWLKHSYEVLIAIKDLNVAVAEAETGQRGYLLTGKDDYLAPYEATLGRIMFLQGELQRLTADNPSEQERLRALTPILERKLGELAETVEIRRHAGFDAALRIMNRGLGRDLMKQVETNLASMIVEEQTLLLTRLAGANSHGAWVRDASLGGTAFAVLTLFWAAWRLNSTATRDALTGLLSRNRIWELLASNDRRSKPKMAAMLSIDLDSFRSVNQVFGSTIGDRLLVEASRRLKQIAGRNYVGRFGSDDFAIYCRRITSAEAERLGFATSAALAQPFEMQGRIFKLTASVGIAHTNNIGGIDLRQGADDALYVAKRQGGNQVVAFSRSMHDTRKALERNPINLCHSRRR